MKDQRKADENRCKHGVDNIDCFECYPSTPQELLGSTDYSDEPNNAKILIDTAVKALANLREKGNK
jgi:hypothetical protein